MKIIALAGGIGSGKSTVSRVLRSMGFEVYDCDSEAKRLMDTDIEILRRISVEISADAVTDGVINRRLLAEVVFNDETLLATLNSIVHSAVIDDIHRWVKELSKTSQLLFVETAILLESGLHNHVDEVWLIDAPVEIRIERACRRDAASRQQISARMSRQKLVTKQEVSPLPFHIIDNSGSIPVLPQIEKLLANHGIPSTYARQWKN